MPLKLTVDKIEDVPEAARGAYVEKEGKFHLDAEVEDVSGLKANLRRALDEKKTTGAENARLKAALGDVDPDEAAEILKSHKAGGTSKGSEADTDKWADREKKLREAYDAKLAPLLESDRKLKEKEYEDQVWSAARAAGALESDRRLILKAAKDDYLKRDENGKVVVLDEYGEETSDDLKTLFAGRFKKENSKLYDSTVGSGGGSAGGSGNRGKGSTATVSATDNAGFIANLDAIADGKVAVTQ